MKVCEYFKNYLFIKNIDFNFIYPEFILFYYKYLNELLYPRHNLNEHNHVIKLFKIYLYSYNFITFYNLYLKLLHPFVL